MFYLTMHSLCFIYNYMTLDIWYKTILNSTFPRQDSKYHSLLHQYWSTGWNAKKFNG